MIFKVAAVSLNQTPYDWKQNTENINKALEICNNADCNIVCFQELTIPGYGCEDFFSSPWVLSTSRDILLNEILNHTLGMVVSIGLPISYGSSVYNCVCIMSHGEIVGIIPKQNLPGDGIHYEHRWFAEWERKRAETIYLSGRHDEVPFGHLLIDVDGLKLTAEICEDAWSPNRPIADMVSSGLDVILNSSSSHFVFGKFDLRKHIVIESSRQFKAAYIYANSIGNESGRAIYDGGNLIANNAELLVCGKRFPDENIHIDVGYIDISKNRVDKWRTSNLKNSTGGNFPHTITENTYGVFKAKHRDKVTCSFKSIPVSAGMDKWELAPGIKYEEFTRAVSLGLVDYSIKSNTNGYIISLSGGRDSAAVACLCRLAIKLYPNKLKDKNFDIYTVYQSAENSSDITAGIAKQVSKSFGFSHLEFNLKDINKQYIDIINDSIENTLLKKPIAWDTDDITLQNIQARIRVTGPSAIANIYNCILLTTSNMSESSIGYTTLDGDMCGGLAPIAGVSKTFIIDWLKWLIKEGNNRYGLDFECIVSVLDLPPTAELRPADKNQTDEDDIMPYNILEYIERQAIQFKKSPHDIYKLIMENTDRITELEAYGYIEKFFKLWSISQIKREKQSPSFHLDERSLDPKTWCRSPLLNGGFRRELDELMINEQLDYL